MNLQKALIISTFLVAVTTTVSAIGPADYNGDLQVNVQSDSVNPGEEIDADISVSNTDDRPVINGYVVVNVVRGDSPYYPSQKSDDDNVFHQRKLEDINLKSDSEGEVDFSYAIPDDIRPGDYRVEAYFKTERTPVEGLPFIYSAPKHDTFTGSGSSGSYPGIEISRTETYFKGINKVIGDWDPDKVNFKETKWPSLTGPVGVLTTESMDNVEGEVFINNPSGSSMSATLDVTVCEWDDTSCSNEIDTVTKSFDVPASGTSVPVEVENPSETSAYAVKMNLSSDGRTQSVYRNRIIREGNTSRIRKLSVSQPYIAEGDEISVGLVAGASPDHYNDPSAEGVNAEVTVEAEGKEVFTQTKEINRLSNANTFEQLYFNSTADSTLTTYTVSAELSAEGEVYDTYSYEVDYSKFENEIEELSLNSYEFNNDTLDLELCGETESGAPAIGEVQSLLMENVTLKGQTKEVIEDCGQLSIDDVEPGNYELVANYGEQNRFNISEEGLESKNQTGVNDESNGGLPLVPLAIVGLLIVSGSIYYLRGDSE
jgi:hypothetical protein